MHKGFHIAFHHTRSSKNSKRTCAPHTLHLHNPCKFQFQHSRSQNSIASPNKWNKIWALKVKVLSSRSLCQAITILFRDSWLHGLLCVKAVCMTESVVWLVLKHMLFMSGHYCLFLHHCPFMQSHSFAVAANTSTVFNLAVWQCFIMRCTNSCVVTKKQVMNKLGGNEYL